jgi:hypothetical protein
VVEMMITEKNAIVFTMLDPDLPMRHVDIFLTAGLSYATLRDDAVTLKLGTHQVKVLSPRKLLQLKKAITPPRQKDALDIVALSRIVDANRKA